MTAFSVLRRHRCVAGDAVFHFRDGPGLRSQSKNSLASRLFFMSAGHDHPGDREKAFFFNRKIWKGNS
ncbi:hypothetical protein DESPIG_00529 [Desulfovibrio piger ATCC 29098]|uniref:Uncharacterized protein n=1 Tax=Desulfovibrio piger ATCC 29098 TaxID=411464 RepID=B6WR48_9BACT|nr:hypothetical protein DESPIG_00529 [Desulfovibrio piger ATCC 29098]